MPESVSLEIGGRTLVIETGELAKQANGSALVRYGDQNVVLCAVTASENPRDGRRFLSPHLRIRREDVRRRKDSGRLHQARRPSVRTRDAERAPNRSPDPAAVPRRLPQRRARSSRRCCRSIPNSTPTCSRVCAPARRSRVSDIPFEKNVAAVRVGRDEDGKYIIQPDAAAIRDRRHGHRRRRNRRRGDDGRRRRERDLSEEDFLGAVEFAHDEIKKIVKAIDKLAKKAGKTKREYPLFISRTRARKVGRENVQKRRRQSDARSSRKQARNAAFDEFTRDVAIAKCRKTQDLRALLEDQRNKDFEKIIKTMEEEELRIMVVDEGLRPDGRKPDEIRPIWSKVALRAARSRHRRFPARTDAGLHRRDARLDRRRAAPRRDHGDSEQALHALLQLPAVLGRRDAPDARPRPARDRPRPSRRTRARSGAAGRRTSSLTRCA